MKKQVIFLLSLFPLLALMQCNKYGYNDDNRLANESIQYIDDNLQFQLEQLAGKNNIEVLSELNNWVREIEGVSSASMVNNSVEMEFVDGTHSSIDIYDLTIAPQSDGNTVCKDTKHKMPNHVVLGNKRAFIWDAFPDLDMTIDEGNLIHHIFENAGFQVSHFRESQCTIEALKQMTQYSYIQLITHGGANRFATGEKVNMGNLLSYLSDRIQGKIKISNLVIKEEDGYVYKGDYFVVTDKFIEGLQNQFDNSILFNGSCLGFVENSPLQKSFMSKGVGAYIGFDNSIVTEITCPISMKLASLMLNNGFSLGEAYDNTFNFYHTCLDFTEYDENTGEVASEFTTCIHFEGNRDLSWYDNPPIPDGVVHGIFTVGPSRKVYFSKGNLWYQASTNTWKFADHQYDYVGDGNANASPTYTGWIDLYCWGTSGWNSGAREYQPFSTNTNYSSYYTGGSPNNSLTGDFANADWAYYNSISNGGCRPTLWRCLTHEEYIYLMEIRENASEKYGYAKVNGTNGLIILPDQWNLPGGLNFVPQAGIWSANSFTAEQWERMEAEGAIFLPATGTRQGNTVFYVGGLGDYWSSTANGAETGNSMSFFNGNVYPDDCRYRHLGTSVRPVHDLIMGR